MEIVIDILHSERVSGWIRGTSEPQIVRLTFNGQVRELRADRPRADLKAPTAFAYIFDENMRSWLRRGETIEITVGDETAAPMHVRFPHSTHKPIAFAIPAGQINARDDVSWYNPEDIAGNLFHYHNIGDSFVYDSTLKVLNFSDTVVLKISTVDEKNINQINENCTAVVLRGSNYFHPNMDWMRAEEVFRRIKVPIVCFGVGIQTPDGKPLELTNDQVRMLHLLGDKTKSIGVRGARTAEEMNRLGVKNVDIIGCPTLFRRRTRHGHIEGWNPDAVHRVAFNVRREVSRDYAHDAASYLRRHIDIFKTFDDAFDTTIMTHGEVAEKIYAFRQERHYAKAEDELLRDGWFNGKLGDPVKNAYSKGIFYSDHVKDYDAFVREYDLVTGYRLHGNLIALANGIPSFYFVYDERTQEICETFHIPYFDVRGNQQFKLENVLRSDLFDDFNQNYAKSYETMVEFLEKNGLPHGL